MPVFGNASVEVTTRKALHILEAAARSGVPVAMGASESIASTYSGPATNVHGLSGLGDGNIPEPTTRPVDQDAADFIYAVASAIPGDLSLASLGPLTNLAAAARHPELIALVDQVIVMGGSVNRPGNITPFAEANIHNDPEAGKAVLSCGWDVSMVGLDVTMSMSR